MQTFHTKTAQKKVYNLKLKKQGVAPKSWAQQAEALAKSSVCTKLASFYAPNFPKCEGAER